MKLNFYHSFFPDTTSILAYQPQTLPPYENDILVFCQEWLHGKEEFILFTSGSTGTPKPIVLSREQMEASAKATAQKLALFDGTQAFLCLHAGYIAGKMMLVRSLVNHWDLTVVPPSNLPFSESTIPLDFAALVPSQLQQTIENQIDKIKLLNQYKAIIVGGAAISPYLEALIQKYLTVPVYNTYGMTETVSHIALKQVNGNNKTSYYTLLPHVEIAQDARECLQIKAPMSNNEWLTTNDIVTLVYEDGRVSGFSWLGRADNVINSGGVKIQIEKVEIAVGNSMQQLQLPQRYCVVGLPDAKWGETVHLVIENEQALSPEYLTALYQLLQNQLTKYELPKQLHYIMPFPQTSTAKIDRNLLKKKLTTDFDN